MNLYKELKKYIHFINGYVILLCFIEATLVIAISIAASNINDAYASYCIIPCGIIYAFIFIYKSIAQIKFPNKIVDDLESKEKLQEMCKLFDRQNHLNKFISLSIQDLNSQTCNFNNDDLEESDNTICDEDLKNGLTNLLNSLVNNTDTILNNNIKGKFTIGVKLNYILEFKNGKLTQDEKLILLRDDFKFCSIITKKLLENTTHKDAEFEIDISIKRTSANNKYSEAVFNHNESEYKILCSPIPEICSDKNNTGVLFIIMEKHLAPPNDIHSILQIFNRLTINYVTKYNNCIDQKAYQYEIMNRSTD